MFEKINFKYDNQKLWDSLWPLLQKNEPARRSKAVSGWALQSTNGSHLDGWDLNFCPLNGPRNKGPSWSATSENEKNMKAMQDYRLPTKINSSSLDELIQQLEALNLNPRKARIINLAKNSEGQWHQDGSSRFYQVRLHIPLVTNRNCFFEFEAEREHMVADGHFYFVHVNRKHRVVNYGDTDRYHFVCNVWDQSKVTQFHQYDPGVVM